MMRLLSPFSVLALRRSRSVSGLAGACARWPALAPAGALALGAEDRVEPAGVLAERVVERVRDVAARFHAARAAALHLAEAEVVELALEARELLVAEVAAPREKNARAGGGNRSGSTRAVERRFNETSSMGLVRARKRARTGRESRSRGGRGRGRGCGLRARGRSAAPAPTWLSERAPSAHDPLSSLAPPRTVLPRDDRVVLGREDLADLDEELGGRARALRLLAHRRRFGCDLNKPRAQRVEHRRSLPRT